MEKSVQYLFAFATLFVVFIIPAAIVFGLVGAPQKDTPTSSDS
jgi:hypothetical protein